MAVCRGPAATALAVNRSTPREHQPASPATLHPGNTPAFLIGSEPAAGISAEIARRLRWLPALSPAPGLAAWLQLREERWSQFCEIYWAVLHNNPQRWDWLARMARSNGIILVYAESDVHLSAARALQQFLRQQDDTPHTMLRRYVMRPSSAATG
jgi:uncharacterized protein YeaO (DUF488 family)